VAWRAATIAGDPERELQRAAQSILEPTPESGEDAGMFALQSEETVR
jgi:hypothetical protein